MQKKTTQKGQSFLYATLILGISTALVKVMGALFRIPLNRLIGTIGMGYFSTAYDIFIPIYSLAMAGLPIAVSRIVAQFIAEKRYGDAKKALSVVQKAFLVTGLVGFVAMFGLAYFIVIVAKNPNALPATLIIAPSVLFCCVMSAYRGYYEGLRNMYPTAVSSVIEAGGKLFLGYGFAWAVMRFMPGDSQTVLSYAAAGAMLGITVGTMLGTLYLFIRHKRTGDGITAEQLSLAQPDTPNKTILKTLILFAIPVAIGSLVNNVASLIDVVMVQRQLHNAIEVAPDLFRQQYGQYLYDIDGNVLPISEVPNFLYGSYKGQAYTIFHLVPTISSVIGISALPVLTMAWTEQDKPAIKANLESMLKVISMIAFPAGIGMAVLAPQITRFLYGTADSVIAADQLRILGIAACFAGLTTPLTNLLQAINRPKVPVINIAVGAVIKIVVNYILVGMPEINILGASIGTLACYGYIAIADIFCLIKYSRVVPSIFVTFLKPLLAALICGGAASASVWLFGKISFLAGHDSLVTIGALGVAVLAYLVAIAVLKCFNREDVLSLPKGEKLARIFLKLHIIR